MNIFDIFENMFERRPILACFLLFFAGFLMGHILCLAVYGIRFLVSYGSWAYAVTFTGHL